jgi:hypothetical protein
MGTLSVGWVALFSGLIGAIITAILNYIVRLLISKRDQKSNEKKMAYVYLVKISELIAIEILVRRIVEAYAKAFAEDINSLKKSADGKFEMSHGICAAIAKAIDEVSDDKLKELNEYRAAFEIYREILEKAVDFKLPIDVLSKLPKQAIQHYSHFESQASSIKYIFKCWAEFIEKGNKTLLKADFIYGQWLSIKFLFDAAHVVRAALIKYGRISNNEAISLLSAQIQRAKEISHASLSSQSKIKEALSAIENDK